MDANVGDLVVCVDARQVITHDDGDLTPVQKIIGLAFLNQGATYTVEARGAWGYFLVGQPIGAAAYSEHRFRKFVAAVADNAELIALIKRPVRRSVTA